MSKVLIKYRVRLSEILRVLPIAKHLAQQKHEVFVETIPAFQSLFGLVSYAKWHDPAKGDAGFDLVLPLQVNPAHSHEYRGTNPAPKFFDFVLGLAGKEFKAVKPQIQFDRMPEIGAVLKKRNVPAVYSIVCPIGFSFAHQRGFGDLSPIDLYVIEAWASGLKMRGDTYLLVPPGFQPNRRFLDAGDIAEAAALICGAQDFATINCAGAAIASATIAGQPLRKQWHYVIPMHPRERVQDDIWAKEQKRWEVSLDSFTPKIIPQKDARQ